MLTHPKLLIHFILAMTNGQVKVIKFPLDDKKLEFQDHMLHSGNISKIRASFDGHYLFSASEDGTIYISKLTDREGNLKRIDDYSFASEILVNKTDIDEKMNLVSDLQTRVEELKLENVRNTQFITNTADL